MEKERSWSWAVPALLCLIVVAALVCFSPAAYRPDRPVATIPAGSSAGPAFVVQIIRPRLGLPLGGILPPSLFGIDDRIGFDSASAGATVGRVDPARLEFATDDWALVVEADAEGRAAPGTEAVFTLVFEERPRRVRCRPGDRAVGWLRTAEPGPPGELSGSFEIELPRCEDADTGVPLGWPPAPFILRGSFDRLRRASE